MTVRLLLTCFIVLRSLWSWRSLLNSASGRAGACRDSRGSHPGEGVEPMPKPLPTSDNDLVAYEMENGWGCLTTGSWDNGQLKARNQVRRVMMLRNGGILPFEIEPCHLRSMQWLFPNMNCSKLQC